MKIQLTVNGQIISLDVSPKKRLLDILRDDLNLIGTKEGCGKGECGSCTVFMDGRRVNSCLVPALQLLGSKIWTIEGVETLPIFQEIAEVYVNQGAVQCGFCFPGVVMSTLAFIQEEPGPYSKDQLAQGMAGNICRCTGYTKILEVVEVLENNKSIKTGIEEILKR
jgi:carbon-monoxide dehydrogenase small subunit